ncbi:hypothetical protein ACQR1I_18440 [Bradyrhizobium sp. HKCCYLS2038]|uniref:hypothetical protein n=1 Tax=unclassified Bradyrhizobium TaxID=2631580 RepID=UPI003EBD7B31
MSVLIACHRLIFGLELPDGLSAPGSRRRRELTNLAAPNISFCQQIQGDQAVQPDPLEIHLSFFPKS